MKKSINLPRQSDKPKNFLTVRTQINRWLLLIFFVFLLLGQLTRVQLTPHIPFYWHDVLICLFLLFNWPFLWAKRRENLPLFYRVINICSLYFIGVIVNALMTNFTLASLLYCGRLFAYVLFLVTTFWVSPFSTREWQQLLLFWFVAFALLGVAQWLFWPDTRSLEVLGWDDHFHRLLSTWLDPAFSALALLDGIIFVYFCPLLKKRGKISFILLFTFCLLFTYSRSTYLAFFACIFFLFLEVIYSRKIKISRKKFFYFSGGLLLALILIALSLAYLAVRFPSDSTNLWRTKSITIRADEARVTLATWSARDWWLGRGFFVARQVPIPAKMKVVVKLTAAIPDNFELLLVSFFGLPIAIVILLVYFCFLRDLYKSRCPLFFHFLALLINAQFNQSFFQPLHFLLLGLIVIVYFIAGHKCEKKKET